MPRGPGFPGSGTTVSFFAGSRNSGFCDCWQRLLLWARTRTIGQAWKVYDRWLEDSRVGIRQEAFELDVAFRAATRPVSRLSSPKALGDCYLLAVSQVTDATLVTFDRGLASSGQKARQPVTLLEPRTLAGG
jgi:predicted nucleic acid-binding protein